jgi:hypothetical protein
MHRRVGGRCEREEQRGGNPEASELADSIRGHVGHVVASRQRRRFTVTVKGA